MRLSIFLFVFLILAIPFSLAQEITFPAGGETFNPGDDITITWNSNSIPESSVVVSLTAINSTYGVGEATPWLYGIIQNTGSYALTIPRLYGGEYFFVLSSTSNNSLKFRSAGFRISESPPTILPPLPSSSETSLSLEPGTEIEDKVGAWGVFVPNGASDWVWLAKLSLNSTKTISSVLVVHSLSGEAWSTSSKSYYNKPLYPIAVFQDNSQLNSAYDQNIGTFNSGEHKLKVYAQKSSSVFYGGTMEIRFSDNSMISAQIPGQTISGGNSSQTTEPVPGTPTGNATTQPVSGNTTIQLPSGNATIYNSSTNETGTAYPQPPTQNSSIQIPINPYCGGCLLNNVCFGIGYRKNQTFCSETQTFIPQRISEEVCDNNFECSSNVCVSGKCISPSLIDRIIEWLKGLFG